jgi:uncharacterized protein YodC (DUF2158 family)
MSENKNWIKSGAEVAHKGNIIQKMYVEDIIKRSKAGGQMVLVIGVKCHWWQESGRDKKPIYQFGTFHTKELVPWEVAMQGQQAVTKFLDSLQIQADDNQ